MNLVLSETHTLYFSILLIPNGKFLRVVAKRMSTVSLNSSKHLAILNYVKIVLLMREMISMTLEGKEKVFTRITWGELKRGLTRNRAKPLSSIITAHKCIL